MKKKISLLLCALMMLLCLSGCTEKTTNANPNTTMMQQVAEAIVVGFSGMAETDFEQFEKMSDFRLNYTMMQSNLPIEAADFRYMMKSWKAAVEENGTYLSHGEYKLETKSNGFALTTETKFEDATVDMVFTFDNEENLISMDVSGQMQTSVIFRRAGLNTILGMGIVFVVLIMLAFIIYLMKYIPRLLNEDKEKNAGHKAVTAQTEVDMSNQMNVNLVDDLELVAVITAAIAAQEGKSADGFVVRSIRRRPSNHWS